MQGAADYYTILGVGTEAESGAIRIAYRNLMRRHHPDVNSSDDAAATATAINEAYACLGDPEKRAAYDRQRTAQPSRPHFSPAAGMAPPRRPAWQPQHAYMAQIDPDLLPRKWNRLSLGLATVLTVVTFAMTSATPPPMPLPPEAVIAAEIDGFAPAPTSPDDARCKTDAMAEGTSCAPAVTPSPPTSSAS